MASIPDMIPVSDLHDDAAEVVRRVQASGEPLVITQEGRAAAVMLSVDAYERGVHERRLLHLLVRGEREIAAGAGHDLEDVLREANALLADELG